MFEAHRKFWQHGPSCYLGTVSSTIRDTHSAARVPRSAFLVCCWVYWVGPSRTNQTPSARAHTLHFCMCIRAPTSGCVTRRRDHQTAVLTACDSPGHWLTGRANRAAHSFQRRSKERERVSCLEPFSARASFFPSRQLGTCCWLLLMITSAPTTQHHACCGRLHHQQLMTQHLHSTARQALSRYG